MTYLTYEGSLTQPGCQETVTWVILNKPLYISTYQLEKLRELTRGNGIGDPLMENNFRPVQPDNRRLVRTNIPVTEEPDCNIKKTTSYTVNNKLKPS
ncbi:carbonic anhydrase-related protein 10-like [Crassostrea virginica]